MTYYVVLDENDYWLYSGEHDSPEEALMEAKNNPDYDEDIDIFIFATSSQTFFAGGEHIIEEPERIEDLEL